MQDRDGRYKENIKELVNRRSNRGELTALHLASYVGNIKMMKLLIFHGGDVNNKTKEGLNSLHIAAMGDQARGIILYRELGGDLMAKDKGGNNALHWAAYMGAEATASYLLVWLNEHIDSKNNKEDTALHIAVGEGIREPPSMHIIKHLLLKGANRNCTVCNYYIYIYTEM